MKNIFYFLLISFLFINCKAQVKINTINTSDLKILLLKDTIQLLDVRSPIEIKEGFIESSLFANYFEDDFFINASKQLDINRPVYLYCRSGNRSGKSAKILQEKGFQVFNVLGGYNQWVKEN